MRKISLLLTISLIPLTLFHILYWPAQYLIVQKYLLIPRIPTIYPTLLLIFLIILSSLLFQRGLTLKDSSQRPENSPKRSDPNVNSKVRNFESSAKGTTPAGVWHLRGVGIWQFVSILFLFSLAFLSYRAFYVNHKDFYQHPIIYSVSPDWAIQGSTITLKGTRFFPSTGERGVVRLDNKKLDIQSWHEDTITGTLPVPDHYGNHSLQITRPDNKKSNILKYQIKDPNKLD